MTCETLSKSHRKHQKDVAKAYAKHQRLFSEAINGNEDAVSVPSGMGKLAIVVSGAPDHRFVFESDEGAKRVLSPREQKEASLEMALRLQSERTSLHRYGVQLHRQASKEAISGILKNPEISDIIMIGHGSISDLWLDNGTHFDWRKAAKEANHLKRGKVEQRMCGHFARDDYRNVPLGTFVVSDFANVIAATGVKLSQVMPPDEAYAPVFVPGIDVIEQIDSLNHQYSHQAEPKKH